MTSALTTSFGSCGHEQHRATTYGHRNELVQLRAYCTCLRRTWDAAETVLQVFMPLISNLGRHDLHLEQIDREDGKGHALVQRPP
jgi:hypothetical protein